MSLKDKRRVIRSLKDKLANRHNVSVAETDYLDSHRRAEIGVAMVSNDARFVESALHRIANEIESMRGATMEDFSIEVL